MKPDIEEYTTKPLSMKEIVVEIREYKNEVYKNYKIIVLVFIPFFFFYVWKYYNTKPVFYADLKFLVEGSASTSGGLGGLLGQFGIKNSGKTNPFKIVEVANSKNLFHKTMFDKYDGDFVANHIITKYELLKKWSKNEEKFQTFKFRHDKFSELDSLERIAFVHLFQIVMGGKNSKEHLISFSYNEDHGVYSYNVKCVDEKLALNLQNKSYYHLKRFFEEDMLENSLKTSIVLRDKADSIQNILHLKIAQLANLQDKSFGLILATPGVKKITLEKEIQALTIAYTEVLKSYELADINLRDSKPLFLMMDESIIPLDVILPSLLINTIKALILSLVFSVGFILIRKYFSDLMKA